MKKGMPERERRQEREKSSPMRVIAIMVAVLLAFYFPSTRNIIIKITTTITEEVKIEPLPVTFAAPAGDVPANFYYNSFRYGERLYGKTK